MLSKNKQSFIRSLHQKKFRDTEGCFIAEGMKVVSELLHAAYRIRLIAGTEEALNTFSSEDLDRVEEVIVVSVKDLEKITALTTPQEILAVAVIPEHEFNAEQLKEGISIMLDDVRDPGNMGTIIRIAHWFGAQQVICSTSSVDAYNPKVVQSSMGSLFHIPVHYCDLESVLDEIKPMKVPVCSAVMNGQNLFEAELPQNGVYVFGNESIGIRSSITAMTTLGVTIPSFELQSGNRPESLNVAVSAAIMIDRKSVV